MGADAQARMETAHAAPGLADIVKAESRVATAMPDHAGESISALISKIYDSALDPLQWPAALADIAAFVPGMSAALFSKDVRDASGAIFHADDGTSPHFRQLYFEKYIKIDPFNSAHVFATVGEPASLADWMPPGEFVRTRIYREWVQPQGVVDFLCVVLDKSATGAAMLGVFRHERDGYADDDARRRMRLIAPHVQRAALIGKAIELKTAEAATLADTLDGIAAGMFLVNAKGALTHMNAAGRTMLERGDVFRLSAGRLVSPDTKTDRAFSESFTSAGKGDAALGSRGVALPLLGRGGEQYVAHVLPLTSSTRRRAGADHAAVAAVFVRKASLDSRGPVETIARTFRLTPAELRVLLAVTEVGGVPETADALGIAETTVRFHLRSLFAKTGTHRQADLVKLLASYSSLLAG